MKSLNCKQQQGMTLLEVLVATGILAIISGLSFISLDNLVRSKQALQEKNQQLNQANLAYYQLQADVSLAVASPNTLLPAPQAEFIGASQDLTLLRYDSSQVPIRRNQQNQANSQPLIRVRWFVRDDQLIRATSHAASPLNRNQWIERPMLALKSFHCTYQNLAGQNVPNWPNTQIESNQLPQWVACELVTEDNLRSVLHLTPYQSTGLL